MLGAPLGAPDMNNKHNTCKVPGCKRPKFSYGMCTLHANRFRRHGDPNIVKRPPRAASPICTYPGCTRPHYGKNLCRRHYQRLTQGKHGLEPSPCKTCGADLRGRRSEQEFCNVSCRMKWYRLHGCYTAERVKASRGACSIAGCGSPLHANGMCTRHAHRVLRHGDPTVDNTKHVAAICKKCGAATGVGKCKDLCRNCYGNRYYHGNLTVERARRNARRSRMKLAMPPWANMRAIRRFYEACPVGMHVDHVIPLKGRRVSGLHVLNNLQYLPALDNRRKLNRFAA